MPYKFLTAASAACVSLLVSVQTALAQGEKTPVKLDDAPTAQPATGGGSMVRTIVGMAIVIGVIYGLYWVLRQVKSSREESASGHGLASIATLPLGPSRSLHMVRAGREIVLVGVSEHGVTPIRTYGLEEAEEAGLLDGQAGFAAAAAAAAAGGNGDGHRNGNGNGRNGAGLRSAIDELRRRTVR